MDMTTEAIKEPLGNPVLGIAAFPMDRMLRQGNQLSFKDCKGAGGLQNK
jgi:hypothetical protein